MTPIAAPIVLWQRYADTWSAEPALRAPQLEACLHEECSYCDPNGLIHGRRALSDYMEGFRQSAVGARFQILAVSEHHGRSLSSWALHGVDGSVLQTGSSFAAHSEDGRLLHITGFFDPQPKAAQGGH